MKKFIGPWRLREGLLGKGVLAESCASREVCANPALRISDEANDSLMIYAHGWVRAWVREPRPFCVWPG